MEKKKPKGILLLTLAIMTFIVLVSPDVAVWLAQLLWDIKYDDYGYTAGVIYGWSYWLSDLLKYPTVILALFIILSAGEEE